VNPTLFGAMMVRLGHADAIIDGLTKHYPKRSAGAADHRNSQGLAARGRCYAMITPHGDIYLLADANGDIEPNADDLAEIAILTATWRGASHRAASGDAELFQLRSTPASAGGEGRQSRGIVKRRAPGLMSMARCRRIPR